MSDVWLKRGVIVVFSVGLAISLFSLGLSNRLLAQPVLFGGIVLMTSPWWAPWIALHLVPARYLLEGSMSVILMLGGVALFTLAAVFIKAVTPRVIMGIVGWAMVYGGHLYWRKIWRRAR